MKTLKIKVMGRVVTGEITHRSPQSIGVKIIAPYSGLSSDDFVFESQKDVINFESEDGLKVARAMLKSLYIICQEAIYRKIKLSFLIKEFDCDVNINQVAIWKIEEMIKERKAVYGKERFLQPYQVEKLSALETTLALIIFDTGKLFQMHFSKYFHLRPTNDGERSLYEFIKKQVEIDV